MADAKAKKKLPSGRHLSQIKRQRQNEKQATRNGLIRVDVRTAVKKVRKAVEGQDKDAASSALQAAARKLQKAVSKGILHRNNSARKISRLSKAVQGL